MQHADRLQQLTGDLQPLRQGQRPVLGEQCRKALAGVFAHHVIQVLALAGDVEFGEVSPCDPAQKPLFHQQPLGCPWLLFARAGQGLEQPGLAVAVTYPVQQRLTAVREQGVDLPTIERLAFTQGAGYRPLLQLRQGIAQAGRTQLLHLHQQGAGVVLAAIEVSAGDQRVSGQLQVGLLAQYRLDVLVPQAGPDAVAHQHVALARLQFTFQVIDQQLLVQAQRALEHMLHARLVPDVVFAQAPQVPLVPAVDPAVANMRQGKTPPA
ncbi:hypothetical protein D3C80_1366310 [compost metagenome]